MARLRLPRVHHLATIGVVTLIAGAIALMVGTHFNLAAVIPISVFISTVPLAISSACQDTVKSVIEGYQLRAEGLLAEGMIVNYQAEDCTVDRLRLRLAELKTPRGRKVATYIQLMAGYEIIETPETTETPETGETPHAA